MSRKMTNFATDLKTSRIMEYIDLGLPSGTKWANCNYGANDPTEYGDYYTFDEAQELPIQLPTKEQLEELIHYTRSFWCGKGAKFIGNNGNTIFFPAAGLNHKGEVRYKGHRCSMWTSTKNDYVSYSACNLKVTKSRFYLDYTCKTLKYSCRGIIS